MTNRWKDFYGVNARSALPEGCQDCLLLAGVNQVRQAEHCRMCVCDIRCVTLPACPQGGSSQLKSRPHQPLVAAPTAGPLTAAVTIALDLVGAAVLQELSLGGSGPAVHRQAVEGPAWQCQHAGEPSGRRCFIWLAGGQGCMAEPTGRAGGQADLTRPPRPAGAGRGLCASWVPAGEGRGSVGRRERLTSQTQ